MAFGANHVATSKATYMNINPSDELEATCPRLKVGRDTVLGVIIRTYLEPATKVGAVMPEVLYDRVMKFSRRK